MFIVRLQNFRNTPRCSVCLHSCTYPFGILDVRRRILRHHWRRAMARCISAVWIWGGYPESGRAIYRAEDLAGDSCATVKKIGLTRRCSEPPPTSSAIYGYGKFEPNIVC